jgi:hypothetical protein
MSKQDTLNISRIPSPQNMPDFLNSSNKGIDLAHSSTKDDLELLAKTATLTAQSGNNFGFSIPKPSGFYGTVTIKNQPAPIGTKITAWQKDVLLSPELTITESGKYNLLLINGDDPDTPEIDGGTSESPIFFKLQTPNGETFASDNNGLWQEAINARLDLSALSSNANAQNSLSIEIRVNDQIVGKDILDGDPISNRAIISAVILGGNDQLTDDNVRLFLNSKQLEKDTYSFITDTDSPEIQGKITYAPNSLAEGEFKLDFDVAETNLTSQKIAASFSFLISVRPKKA